MPEENTDQLALGPPQKGGPFILAVQHCGVNSEQRWQSKNEGGLCDLSEKR
jgi:hypothetical protein